MKGEKPILIGQAAAKSGVPRALFPLDPKSSGGRLQRMSGLTVVQYLNEFESFNTLEWFPGRSEVGDNFDVQRGMLRASQHLAEKKLYQRVCIFVGKANANCYNWGSRPMPTYPFKWMEFTAGGCWAWIPHTSGVVKFWNNPYHKDQVPLLFLQALRFADRSPQLQKKLEVALFERKKDA